MRKSKLIVDKVSVSYPVPHTGSVLEAIANVTLQVVEGEFVSIVGPSGCGKTTLLRTVAGLVQPTTGGVCIVDERSPHPTALVFQQHGLFPWLTSLDNLAFGLETQGVAKADRLERANTWLEKLGLADFAQSYPHELSGGMQQRVGIGRAFVCDPGILLMDEPFGALDAQTRLLMQAELLQLWQDAQKTVLYVTHDIREAILLADRVLVMGARPGTIIDEVTIPLARPRDLLSRQADDEETSITELQWHIWSRLQTEARQSK